MAWPCARRSAPRRGSCWWRRHGEAVVRDGPFVMNTREEVEQARDDYRNRRNGFEMAAGWSSDYAATVAAH
uniref:Pirin C-terminal domain-containing protein n=1 Tax=Oryza brachyantha TaxID=4533 RepID=J3MSJ5_ORYBR